MALADLVSILAKHEVEFIIVGEMAAVLRGTPVNTFDLDVVYERGAINIGRLLQALADELDGACVGTDGDSRRTRAEEFRTLLRQSPATGRAAMLAS
jgi:hypothetical protein